MRSLGKHHHTTYHMNMRVNYMSFMLSHILCTSNAPLMLWLIPSPTGKLSSTRTSLENSIPYSFRSAANQSTRFALTQSLFVHSTVGIPYKTTGRATSASHSIRQHNIWITTKGIYIFTKSSKATHIILDNSLRIRKKKNTYFYAYIFNTQGNLIPNGRT